MLNIIIKRILKYFAFKRGNFIGLYLKVCKPTSDEFNEFLRQHRKIHFIGTGTHINYDVNITDPPYVSVGNNCILSSCTLVGHDGVVGVLNNSYGKKLDSVGKIDIRDNCFIGIGAIVMPNVTIGPNSIVSAGAVVTRDVAPGVVVGGVPAKVIGTTDILVQKLIEKTQSYPWRDLIEQRNSSFDIKMEPELQRMRVKFFYGD